MQCLCRKGTPNEAKETLDEMVARGFRPTVATFSAVVGCLCKRGRITRAMEMFDTTCAVGCEPTIRTYNSLIGGSATSGGSRRHWTCSTSSRSCLSPAPVCCCRHQTRPPSVAAAPVKRLRGRKR
uniref:Pentacotripeptide-repeat region of PRORP domain-containing protein n=1 Tax=Oryza nivara TaxID=4536 RepID=A0A0E0HCB1_ORYNI